MNIKDRDIEKLKQCINNFGLKLFFKKYTKLTGSAEYVAGTSISLFMGSRTTKTDIILSLLHELGHHVDWLKNRKTDKDSSIALRFLLSGPMVGNRQDIPKKHRKKILQIEKAGVKYMSMIHKRLKLEIPLYKVKHQQEIDIFDYKFLYENGRFATSIEAQQVYKKIGDYRKKYGKKRKK